MFRQTSQLLKAFTIVPKLARPLTCYAFAVVVMSCAYGPYETLPKEAALSSIASTPVAPARVPYKSSGEARASVSASHGRSDAALERGAARSRKMIRSRAKFAAKSVPRSYDRGAVATTKGRAKRRGPTSSYRVSPQSNQLTAGEWSDLSHWMFWRNLFDGQGDESGRWHNMSQRWGIETSGRIPVDVRMNSQSVANATVRLKDNHGNLHWVAKTDLRGRAELFIDPALKTQGGLSVVVETPSGKIETRVPKKGGASTPLTIELPSTNEVPKLYHGLDLMFVVDTTGSMGDELEYLKNEVGSVVEEVAGSNAQNFDIRTSVNFYRDTSDLYTVRAFPFERDISTVLEQLSSQSAGGGGDFPEAVDAALDNAIYDHHWREDARARIIFLVLDAPPHESPEIQARVARATREAAARGIRIIPIAGSGINKDTECLMRMLAISTAGSYVFLTDHSGIGGSHIKPTIGPHNIELLSHLLVKIINRYVQKADRHDQNTLAQAEK
jgi:hypothetical protein